MRKKWLMFLGIGVGVAALARKCASVCSSRSERSAESEKPTKWDKMRARMEQMPEDFPPRVMFDNVQIARDNTERILEILKTVDVHASETEVLVGTSQ